ncbi:23S rRNA (adenine(1618)-N(6))-methyltransferase RlmF [Motilimonas cestriensis]|uniref:Ribosomal RNA large subunit methyltransferase F n=1 Tax=Motilimonas cestriensis TaxID=2742685 RepID=A0ABS8W800_9GAMM|nr:23S rRNA (adenine(1618)-N(6))-methyltransferase RlmF [Motilimonas cestriensis]MCE2593651.1 23S rRNA (adenine(1618)-N(6))-methyltransferase RlmF [Motilimonas cestriensis]
MSSHNVPRKARVSSAETHKLKKDANQPNNKASGKGALHPRNPHVGRYDFSALCLALPALSRFLVPNPKGDSSIDFSNEQAVLCLNQALLAHYYQVKFWQIPAGYLCPPIPGRADYIHYGADLLARLNQGKVPIGKKIKLVDIGTGANCIYPIIGSQSYGWSFIASDIDPVSVKTAQAIVQSNPNLTGLIDVKQQSQSEYFFKGIIKAKLPISLTVCNPPFHASLAEAHQGSQRKWQNLNKGKEKTTGSGNAPTLNFGGQKAELWCPGGELAFLKRMATESVGFAEQVCWFSSLVAKGEHVRPLKKHLQQLNVAQCEVIQMQQGQKISRILAWSFKTLEQQQAWAEQHWGR